MQQIALKKEPNLNSKHEAFPYQSEAVRSICELEYTAIFHEQGLGKSKIAIDLMLYWLEKKIVDTVLFVSKKTLVYNWEKEFSAHTFMKPKLFNQNKKSNYYIFNSPSRLMLCHYEMILSEYERFNLFLRSRNVAVILDESAKIKNPDSGITKAFFELAPLFKKRVIMTGTPVANRPYDIWAQIYFLDKGNSLGSDFNSFKRNADLSNDLSEDIRLQENFENYVEGIFKRISHFTVRETKRSGIIELPEKEIRKIITDWETCQYDLYHQISEETRAIVIQEGVPSEDNSEQLLKRLLRLVQVASNPALIDDGYINEPGKLESLKNIIYEVISKKEKCIIWSAFTKNVDWLTLEFKKYGACKIHGKLNIEQRNKSIESFLTKDDVRILIATPGAAKEGLTLTSANHVIFYDRTFSLDDYLQAQDRIHRISQNKKCFVYNLIMKNSIDEWVDTLLEGKHLAAQLAQGDISLSYYKTKMSYDFGTIIKHILNIK